MWLLPEMGNFPIDNKDVFVGISCEIAIRWMPKNTLNEKSSLVQVIVTVIR